MSRMIRAANASRATHVLRAAETHLTPDPWQLKLPRVGVWWEVLSPRKVRLAPDSHNLYFVTYERERKETILTLFKSDCACEWRVVVKARVDADPDDLQPRGRKRLLVVVDEVADRVTVVYQPTPALDGVGSQGFVLRHMDMRQTGAGSAAVRLGPAYKARRVPVPACLPASEQHASLNLSELLFHQDELLLSAMFELSSCHVHLALFLLVALEPQLVKVELLSSLTGESASLLLNSLNHKGKFICAPGAVPISMLLDLCVVMEPVVLPQKSVEACTLFAGATTGSSGQATLARVFGCTELNAFVLLGEWRGWLLLTNQDGASENLHAIRGWNVANTHVVVVRKFDVRKSALKWAKKTLPKRDAARLLPALSISLHGGGLMVQVAVMDKVSPFSIDRIYLTRIKLDSWLPEAPLCSNCHTTEPPSAPSKVQACKICKARGFDGYPWLFGSRFCGAECAWPSQKAWPSHRSLHKWPPLDHWTLDDWNRWRSRFKPNLDTLF